MASCSHLGVDVEEITEVIVVKNEQPDEDACAQLEVIYAIEETPVWYLAIFLGIQHYVTMIGLTIAVPFILTPLLCIADDDPARGIFFSTIIFVSGIATLIQTTFGVRLPIVQGGTFAFLVPTIAILTTSFKTCDQYDFINMTLEDRSELWHVRIREIQGDIMVASLFQIIIGFTGLIGFLLTWITPLSITPTVTLIGLSLFNAAAKRASGNWGVAFLTIIMVTAFSQYLSKLGVPIPTYRKKEGFKMASVRIFDLFPVLLALILSWLFCVVLTSYDVFGANDPARTDIRINVIHQAPWFYVPYPFQWGWPTVTVAGVFGIFAGVLSSVIESIGDYYACARLAGAPPPPIHATNRGIGIEGIGCLLAGILGSGNGTTSHTENIGAIRVTKVASRSVVQISAVIMIFCGIFGKLGGLFVTLPDPVMGGFFMVMFSLVTAVGLSNLQFVNLNSSRNLFTLGFSLFFGLALPNWLQANPDFISTGIDALDNVITVLISTPMFVGGFLGLVLDNTIPGTPEERGLNQWNKLLVSENGDKKVCTVYDLPFHLEYLFNRWTWCSRVPFSSAFTSVAQNDGRRRGLTLVVRRCWMKMFPKEGESSQ